jgi:hypothetical protein
MFAKLLTAGILTAAGAQLAQADAKRPVPDYDGRGNADAHDESWALRIPRVALWPVAEVYEQLVRKPLGVVVSTAEHKRWPARIHDFFTFGRGQRDYVIPTVAYEFGLQPSIGAYLAMVDAGVTGNSLRVHAATGGADWLASTVVDDLHVGRSTFSLRASAVRRPDYLFLGLGPETTSATRSRYGRQRGDARLTFAHALPRESSVAISAGAQSTSFRPAACCGDPAITARVAAGTLDMPPGYGDGYTALYQAAELELDSRLPRPAPATGAYLHVHGQTSFDVVGDRSWIGYGGEAGAALDLDGHQRTLKLETGIGFVDPLRGQTPFDELASLSPNLMPGFVTGWMTGRSTFATQLAYTWPVWIWLDGELRLAAGNAFGARLEDLRADTLRLSGEVGLMSNAARDNGFEIVVGAGTDAINLGAHLDSVRLAVRTRRGL